MEVAITKEKKLRFVALMKMPERSFVMLSNTFQFAEN
jgi:hypothetical protein